MAKKKLTKSKVVAEKEAIEDTIEYAEPVIEPIEDFEEVKGTIGDEEGSAQSAFEFDEIGGSHEMSSMPVLGDEQGSMYIKASLLPDNDFNPADPLYWTQKTFFDFTYECSHPDTGHCIECYNRARKG